MSLHMLGAIALSPRGGMVATVTVSPATPSLEMGKTMQFFAVATDGTGKAFTPPVVSWSADGKGAIDPSGNFTPLAPGTCIITARAGSVSGQTTVTITEAARDTTSAKAPSLDDEDEENPEDEEVDDIMCPRQGLASFHGRLEEIDQQPDTSLSIRRHYPNLAELENRPFPFEKANAWAGLDPEAVILGGGGGHGGGGHGGGHGGHGGRGYGWGGGWINPWYEIDDSPDLDVNVNFDADEIADLVAEKILAKKSATVGAVVASGAFRDVFMNPISVTINPLKAKSSVFTTGIVSVEVSGGKRYHPYYGDSSSAGYDAPRVVTITFNGGKKTVFKTPSFASVQGGKQQFDVRDAVTLARNASSLHATAHVGAVSADVLTDRAGIVEQARQLVLKAAPPSGHAARLICGFGYGCMDRADKIAEKVTGNQNFLQKWLDEGVTTTQTRANERARLDTVFKKIPASDAAIPQALWEEVRKAVSACIAEYSGQMGGVEYMKANLGSEAWLDAWGSALKNLPHLLGETAGTIVKDLLKGVGSGLDGVADGLSLPWWGYAIIGTVAVGALGYFSMPFILPLLARRSAVQSMMRFAR